MPTIDLNFPVLVKTEVRDKKRHFVVRPLFVGAPEGAGRLFERAMQNCLNEVRRQFRAIKTDRSNVDALLWFRFDPDLETRVFTLALKSGSRAARGSYRAAWFDLAGERYCCLPGFGHHLFIAARDDRGRYDMESEAARVAQHLLREEIREHGDNAPDPASHTVAPHEFVTAATTSVHVDGDRFPFDRDDAGALFASLFREGGDFNGAVELDRTSRDLNALWPEDILRAHGADALAERVRTALFEGDATPTVLIGPRGSGKTTLVHEAVARTLASAPSAASDKIPRVWHLDPNRVIAGMSVVGMWQNRFEAILAHVRDRLRKRHRVELTDALFVDNPVALLRVGQSSQNTMTLSDVLKPYLERRELRFVAEATPEAWKLVQELDRGFADLFQTIRVPEPPLEEAVRIAAKQRARLERDFDSASPTRLWDG